MVQIASSEISARLSADGTVSFFDPPVTFDKGDVDSILAQVQEQAALLTGLEKEMARSKEYLTKVLTLISFRRQRCDVLLHVSDPMTVVIFIVHFYLDPSYSDTDSPLQAVKGKEEASWGMDDDADDRLGPGLGWADDVGFP